MITAQNINANRLGHNREWENSWFTDKNRVYLGTYRKYPENTPLAKGINKGQNQDTKDFINKDLKLRVTVNRNLNIGVMLNKDLNIGIRINRDLNLGVTVNRDLNLRIFNPMRITKRYMHKASSPGINLLKKTRNLLTQGTPFSDPNAHPIFIRQQYQTQQKAEATVGVFRRLSAVKEKNPLPEAKENGISIMNSNDGSGKSHKLLGCTDVKENGRFKVFGTFTSSPKVNGNPTTLISANNRFDGKPKPQYLYEFETHKLIDEGAVEEIFLDSQKVQNDPEYVPWVNKMIINHNIQDDTTVSTTNTPPINTTNTSPTNTTNTSPINIPCVNNVPPTNNVTTANNTSSKDPNIIKDDLY